MAALKKDEAQFNSFIRSSFSKEAHILLHGGGSSSQDGNPDDQLDPDNQADDSLELYHQCPGYN